MSASLFLDMWRLRRTLVVIALMALAALVGFYRVAPAGAAPAADYVVAISGPAQVVGGGTVTIPLRVTNQNYDPLGIPLGRKLVVRVVLPAQMKYQYANGNFFSCTPDGSAMGGVVTCTSYNDARYLENGLSLGVSGVMAARPDACMVTFRAVVDPTNQIPETNEFNNEAVSSATVTSGCRPDLTVAIKGPAQQVAGPLSYTFDVSNIGGTATPAGVPVVVRVTAPFPFSYGGFTGSSAWTCLKTATSIDCTTTTSIAAGGTSSFTLSGVATSALSSRQVRVDADVSADYRVNEEPSTNNHATLSTLINAANPPVITGFSPISGAAGSSVTITGANLGGALSVTFNLKAAVITANSATSVTAIVPAGATSGLITVSTANGTAASAAGFTVTSSAAPLTISGFAPTSGVRGARTTITGTGFAAVTAVNFNGAPASFTVDSPTSISATVPGGATTGPIRVTAAGVTVSSGSAFTVIPQPLPLTPPGITGFSPAAGAPGASITITGVKLTGTSSVIFGGVRATVFQVLSDSQVTVTVPAGAGSGPIGIVAATGSATSTMSFTVTSATCSAWNVAGAWQMQQEGGYTPVLALYQSGGYVWGTLTFSNADRDRAGLSANTYSVTGSVAGNRLALSMTGPARRDGKPVNSQLTATVTPTSLTSGIAYDLTFNVSRTWNASGTARCA